MQCEDDCMWRVDSWCNKSHMEIRTCGIVHTPKWLESISDQLLGLAQHLQEIAGYIDPEENGKN